MFSVTQIRQSLKRRNAGVDAAAEKKHTSRQAIVKEIGEGDKEGDGERDGMAQTIRARVFRRNPLSGASVHARHRMS